jgi:hypothetical protein
MMVLLLFLLAVFFVALTVEDRLLEFKEEADARRAEDEDKDADNIIYSRCRIKRASECSLRVFSFGECARVLCADVLYCEVENSLRFQFFLHFLSLLGGPGKMNLKRSK